MKACVLIYNGFIQFEVILPCLFMKGRAEVIIAAPGKEDVVSCEGFVIKPNVKIEDLDIKDLDILIIPGGEVENIYNNEALNLLLKKFNGNNKIIAAICSAPVHLAKAGVLKGRKFTMDKPTLLEYRSDFVNCTFVNDNLVNDGNIITAKPCGYVDFAIEIGKTVNAFENMEDLMETIKFFKYHIDDSN